MEQKKKLTLNIFDFDGTLFKSPEPNPSLWHSSMIGKIQSMPKTNGLGWFQETITLDHPYVPISPHRDEWFHSHVLEDALHSCNNKNDNITCLLTGRTTIYKEIIERILESVQLKFDIMGLKPVDHFDKTKESTFEFKRKFILDLLSSYPRDSIGKIVVYEDRVKHVEQFRAFLATIKGIDSYKVVFIDEAPKYLPREMEMELVGKLVEKNGVGYIMKPIVDYSCVELDRESHERLKRLVDVPADWTIKAHHVTMNLGTYNPKYWYDPEYSSFRDSIAYLPADRQEEELEKYRPVRNRTVEQWTENYPIGKKLELKVEAIGINSNALAVKVSGVPSVNVVPHSTIAHHPKGRAHDSNHIEQWYPLSSISAGQLIHSHPPSADKLGGSNNPIDLDDDDTPIVPAAAKVISPSKSRTKSSTNNEPVSLKVLYDFKKDGPITLRGTIAEVGKIGIEQIDGGKNQITFGKLSTFSCKNIYDFLPLRIIESLAEKGNNTVSPIIQILNYLKSKYNAGESKFMDDLSVPPILYPILRVEEIRNWIFSYFQSIGKKFHDIKEHIREMFMEEAIIGGNLEHVKLYTEKRFFVFGNYNHYFRLAVQNTKNLVDERFEILKFLIENQVNFTGKNDFINARIVGEFGNVQLFEYILDENLKLPGYKISNSIFDSRLPVVKFLLENPKYTKYIKKGFGDNELDFCFFGDLETVKYFYENQIIKLTQYSILGASKFGYFDVLKFLIENKTSDFEKSLAFESAFISGNSKVINYLLKLFPQYSFRNISNYTIEWNLDDETIEILECLTSTIPTIKNPFNDLVCKGLSLNGIIKANQLNIIDLKGTIKAVGSALESGNFILVRYFLSSIRFQNLIILDYLEVGKITLPDHVLNLFKLILSTCDYGMTTSIANIFILFKNNKKKGYSKIDENEIKFGKLSTTSPCKDIYSFLPLRIIESLAEKGNNTVSPIIQILNYLKSKYNAGESQFMDDLSVPPILYPILRVEEIRNWMFIYQVNKKTNYIDIKEHIREMFMEEAIIGGNLEHVQ
eukprot:gene3657-4555_t